MRIPGVMRIPVAMRIPGVMRIPVAMRIPGVMRIPGAMRIPVGVRKEFRLGKFLFLKIGKISNEESFLNQLGKSKQESFRIYSF
jgi:hypothetical protein